jgi:hypothetical protein
VLVGGGDSRLLRKLTIPSGAESAVAMLGGNGSRAPWSMLPDGVDTLIVTRERPTTTVVGLVQ